MKPFKLLNYLVSYLLAVLFVSCNPDTGIDYVNYGWDNFPFERVDSYFPADGTSLWYISTEGDSVLLQFSLDKIYEEHPNAFDGMFSTAQEMYDVFVNMSVLHTTKEIVGEFPDDMYISVYDNRKRADFVIRYSENNHFGNSADYSIYNKTGRRDGIFQYLTDTITLCRDDEDIAMIARNKGLVWFRQQVSEKPEYLIWSLCENK